MAVTRNMDKIWNVHCIRTILELAQRVDKCTLCNIQSHLFLIWSICDTFGISRLWCGLLWVPFPASLKCTHYFSLDFVFFFFSESQILHLKEYMNHFSNQVYLTNDDYIGSIFSMSTMSTICIKPVHIFQSSIWLHVFYSLTWTYTLNRNRITEPVAMHFIELNKNVCHMLSFFSLLAFCLTLIHFIHIFYGIVFKAAAAAEQQ